MGASQSKSWENPFDTYHTTKPDTWLPYLRGVGPGLYLMSLDHLDKSGEVKSKVIKKKKNMKNQLTDKRTKRVVESRARG